MFRLRHLKIYFKQSVSAVPCRRSHAVQAEDVEFGVKIDRRGEGSGSPGVYLLSEVCPVDALQHGRANFVATLAQPFRLFVCRLEPSAQ